MKRVGRRFVLASAGAAVLAAPLPLRAEPAVGLIDAATARARQSEDGLVLIDVRQPEEWADSGIAEGAETIAMRDAELGAKLTAALGGDRTRPVALICATGVRSKAVADAMVRNGFTNVYSVEGGMFGSARGVGWLRSGLPVTPVR